MKFHYSNIPLFPLKEIIGETREMNRPEFFDKGKTHSKRASLPLKIS